MLLSEKEAYRVHKGDCIPHMLEEMPAHSVPFAITSVPFPSMFAYTDKEEDIGNSEDLGTEAKIHLGFFFRGLARVLRPGRPAVVHCMQIPLMKRSGKQGIFDFRGLLIRLGLRAGLTYEFDWHVRKNPQAQAIRNKSWALKFQGVETDRAMSRGALGDYLIKFRARGDNDTPIVSKGEVTRNDWIDWAEGSWDDIVETDTLNIAEGDEEGDTRHICPLQLGLIERCIRLFSMPDEVVFDPFMGIGSTAFVALGGKSPKTGRRLPVARRAYGCELKDGYHAAALANCERAMKHHKEGSRTLFDSLAEAPA